MKWILCGVLSTICVMANCAFADEPSKNETPLEIRRAIDAYLDQRFLPGIKAAKATAALVKKLKAAKVGPEELEKLLRAGRVTYPKSATKGKLLVKQKLQCEHVDYSTEYFLYVPKKYDPKKPAPLLIVGHGGNSAMSVAYARRASLGGLTPWLPTIEKEGMILVAPLTGRGWGPIGNSIVVSLISKMQRAYNIDPDRIYITGHSMGGHLSWRSAITMADRWAAVSPMSGGYDYVKNNQVYNLVNVPGYATFGKREPFGINKFNNKIKQWMAKHDYDWELIEKPGGHQIFRDEIPKIAQFFRERPRNLYRKMVYVRLGGKLVFDTPWKLNTDRHKHVWKEGRAIPFSMVHWLRLVPLPEDTPKEKRTQLVQAKYDGKNKFIVVTQNAKKVQIYLHPRMVDFAKPITIEVNGKALFQRKAEQSLRIMLDLVREFDDRGRIFHAVVELPVKDNGVVPEPHGPKKGK